MKISPPTYRTKATVQSCILINIATCLGVKRAGHEIQEEYFFDTLKVLLKNGPKSALKKLIIDN